ncbi:hypothetical protein [Aromatoleum anaerobium]|uniref:Uncharacterized protein n=1 Tax=Aromatoleum anaerobium TaxID=182180 RepID=A0ABX1PPT6_9RHOO|nr:hypothetical protein [Aromatoleum anaerobium]MCK0507915.1 hypothetical protein [Aromatoleum anaerobium]
MSSERELLQRVAMGMEAEAFLGSNIGRYLVERAETERDDAVGDLKAVSPDDPKAIRDLQNRIWRAESVQFWLADLINDGNNAMHELQAREATD